MLTGQPIDQPPSHPSLSNVSAAEFPVFWIAGSLTERTWTLLSSGLLPGSAVGVCIGERRGLREHDERTLEPEPECSN